MHIPAGRDRLSAEPGLALEWSRVVESCGLELGINPLDLTADVCWRACWRVLDGSILRERVVSLVAKDHPSRVLMGRINMSCTLVLY